MVREGEGGGQVRENVYNIYIYIYTYMVHTYIYLYD